MSVITLNIGGTIYQVTEKTLQNYPKCFITKSVNTNRYLTTRELFIDRNGRLFEFVLDFMRHGPGQNADGQVVKSTFELPRDEFLCRQLRREARFYGLPEMCSIIEEQLQHMNHDNHNHNHNQQLQQHSRTASLSPSLPRLPALYGEFAPDQRVWFRATISTENGVDERLDDASLVGSVTWGELNRTVEHEGIFMTSVAASLKSKQGHSVSCAVQLKLSGLSTRLQQHNDKFTFVAFHGFMQLLRHGCFGSYKYREPSVLQTECLQLLCVMAETYQLNKILAYLDHTYHKPRTFV